MELVSIISSLLFLCANLGLLLCGERVKECIKRKEKRKEPYDDLFKEFETMKYFSKCVK
tara:strand:+ start:780 stop:956 length:177 start_codon:yes stop_codon:yes gene_type:complete